MSDPIERIVVVGGGVAGARSVMALREFGFLGRIELVCAEPYLPYDRPPLSKEFLVSTEDMELPWILPETFIAAKDISVHQGRQAVAINRQTRHVVLADGTELPYDRAILATGGLPRQIDFPGSKLQGVVTLRTADDAARIRKGLNPGAHVVVLGGGFIGLEVAAAASARSCKTTVIEHAERVAVRVAPPEVSQAIAALHRAHQVDIRCSEAVIRAEGSDRIGQVALASGEILRCDLLVLGIGMVPGLSLAEAAGLEVSDGVLTDARGQTSDPNIFAVGDIALAYNPASGRQLRVESWDSARVQAANAAAAICGTPPREIELPWAWSDQYDRTLQVLGVIAAVPEIVVRPSEDEQEALVFGILEKRIVYAAALGRAGDFAVARRLAKQRIPVIADHLVDPQTPLRSLLLAQASSQQ